MSCPEQPAAFSDPADQQAFQHAVRQRDLLGLSCLLSHGFGLNAPLIEGLVESCGPRGVQDCFLEAVASARYLFWGVPLMLMLTLMLRVAPRLRASSPRDRRDIGT